MEAGELVLPVTLEDSNAYETEYELKLLVIEPYVPDFE